MSLVLSRKVQVQKGVYRNVHIRENGKAIWVAPVNGKSYAITGDIVGDTFVPTGKNKDILKLYVPKRRTYKKESVAINFTASPAFYNEELGRATISFDGKDRSIQRTGPVNGSFHYNKKRVRGTFLKGEKTFVVTASPFEEIAVGKRFRVTKQ